VRRDDSGAAIFEPVDLELGAGQRMGLLGPSGVGKTLLLRTLTLLDAADDGQVLFRGEAIGNEDVPAYRRKVFLLAQSSPMIDGTVRMNLELPFTLSHTEGQTFDLDRAKELLARFGLASLLERAVGDLSGGERQIVALIRAVLLDPVVLLLDEPTSAMDPQRVETAEALIDEWHKGDERASIWVSHDASQIARTTNTTLDMRLADGPAS
jgi:putative ABC transport system ATP-binding protein